MKGKGKNAGRREKKDDTAAKAQEKKSKISGATGWGHVVSVQHKGRHTQERMRHITKGTWIHVRKGVNGWSLVVRKVSIHGRSRVGGSQLQKGSSINPKRDRHTCGTSRGNGPKEIKHQTKILPKKQRNWSINW